MSESILDKVYRRGFDYGKKLVEGEFVNFAFTLPDILREDGGSVDSKFNHFCSGIVSGAQSTDHFQVFSSLPAQNVVEGLASAERESALDAAIAYAEERCADLDSSVLCVDCATCGEVGCSVRGETQPDGDPFNGMGDDTQNADFKADAEQEVSLMSRFTVEAYDLPDTKECCGVDCGIGNVATITPLCVTTVGRKLQAHALVERDVDAKDDEDSPMVNLQINWSRAGCDFYPTLDGITKKYLNTVVYGGEVLHMFYTLTRYEPVDDGDYRGIEL